MSELVIQGRGVVLEKRASMFRARQITNHAENLSGTLAASRRQVCEEERGWSNQSG